ncbi:MAG: hypothetical protein MI810_03965 [Flavobacteriales bacterium]|nr:hypothetical protein [Flavobacteriales bacterium]
MKKVFHLIVLFATLSLTACGGEEAVESDGSDSTVVELDFADMNEISLKDNGLNMCIMLPEVASSTGASIEPSIEHEDGDYLWNVKIGSRFHLIIEDFGKEKEKVVNEKKRLDDLQTIFNIEYIIDEPGIIMYKRTLHEGLGGKPSYHCYGETVVDGYTYVLRSHEDGSLKPIIEDMEKTIRSAKQCTGAAS